MSSQGLNVVDRIFELHDDIRHVVIVNSMGQVVRIASRAKVTWPEDLIRQFSGLMATVVLGVSEKVQNIVGNIEYLMISYEKSYVILLRSKEFIFIVSARKTMPSEILRKLASLLSGR